MNFYPKGNRGTIRGQKNFNSMTACVDLFKAMRGAGSDKEEIIKVVTAHTASQRKELREKYRYVYKKILREVLDGELSFNFGKIVDALMADPEEYVLECIHHVLTPHKFAGRKLVRRLSQLFSNGLGKGEYVLIDLLCYKSNEYLEAVKKAYKEKYEHDLEDELSDEEGNMLSQDFRNIIQEMLACERDESKEIDEDQLAEDAEDLEDPDVAEVAVQAIFQERSYPHIRKLAKEYRKATGKTLETMIEESVKFSDEQKATYNSILTKIKSEADFYAERLHAAFEGIGTDDDALIRIVVLRSEVDLLDIMSAYKQKYGIDLATNVANETSGEYQEILLKIIRVPEPHELSAASTADTKKKVEDVKKIDLEDGDEEDEEEDEDEEEEEESE